MESLAWKTQLGLDMYQEKGLSWSLPVLGCVKPGQDCAAIQSDCSFTDVSENEQGGGCRDLFFPMATKKQEVMGGKQWSLVDEGETKAEGWVKAVVKLVLFQPLFHMEH